MKAASDAKVRHVTDKVNVLQFFQSIHEELTQEEPEKRISFQKRFEI